MTTGSAIPAKRLEGKVAIITGGASGIGEATARLFAAHGAKVIIADIQDELGKKVSEDLRSLHSSYVDYVHCDVGEEEDVSALVNFAVTKYGCLDIMFNNAGVANLGAGSMMQNIGMGDFDKTMGINVRGAVLGVKHASRVMIPAKRGCILCTASITGVLATQGAHSYCISKHAVLGVVKSAASELGEHGIRVNCISPSLIATPMVVETMKQFIPDADIEFVKNMVEEMTPLKGVRMNPGDIAMAALYLASEDARCVTGHNLIVDGGFTISKPMYPSAL